MDDDIFVSNKPTTFITTNDSAQYTAPLTAGRYMIASEDADIYFKVLSSASGLTQAGGGLVVYSGSYGSANVSQDEVIGVVSANSGETSKVGITHVSGR